MRYNLLNALSDNIRIDHDKCIYCGNCADRCIMDNIRLKVSPCRQACPLGVNIQGFVQLVHRGQEDEARAELIKQLPFPSLLAHVCDAPCEKNCAHERLMEKEGHAAGQGVGINDIKRYLFKTPDILQAMPLPEKEKATGKRVAIVGSGPAGLMAAYENCLQGHSVTIFEREAEAGGTPNQIIPDFRLPKAILTYEIERLCAMGVEIQYSCNVGTGQYTIEKLAQNYDAVIIAVGLSAAAQLGIEGEKAQNVQSALAFLKEVKAGKGTQLQGTVAIIGGGNVAVDAALVALRQGADKVYIVCLETQDTMPAFEEERLQALKEGVSFECSWGIKNMQIQDNKVTELSIQHCKCVFDAQGMFAPLFDQDVQKTLKVDHVFTAIGLQREQAFLESAQILPATLTQVNSETLHMHNNIFIAGDFASGASSVAKAMASGKVAATSVNLFLSDIPIDYARNNHSYDYDFDIDTSKGECLPKAHPPMHQCSQAGDYSIIRGTLSKEQARNEAKRCHSCGGPHGKFRTCWYCLPCEVDCPQEALYVEIPYLLR